LIRFIL